MEEKNIDQILIALQEGKEDALENLYDNTSKQLYVLCYSFFHNRYDSEDALYDSYLKIQKEIQNFNGKKGFNWIYTITKNICINNLKKNNKIKNIDFQSEEAISLNKRNFQEVTLQDESGIIALSKEVLNENEFRILILHAVAQLKFGEISSMTHKLETTVRWQYNNALKKVKDEFERRNKYDE